MKKLLFLAFFLYNIIFLATGSYDYDDLNRKRHSIDDRKYNRQKILEKSPDGRLERIDNRGQGMDHWDEDKKRYSVYNGVSGIREPGRAYEDRDHNEGGYTDMDRMKEYEHQPYRVPPSRFDDPMLPKGPENIEVYSQPHSSYVEKEPLRKTTMNCDRPHERYEPCFSGCASVSCDNPRDRLRPCYPFCESGCVCVHPYVRDDRTHKCVLPSECSKGLKGIPDLSIDK